MSSPFIPDDSTDRLIADRLPAWLASAGIDPLRALYQALRREQQMAAHVALHLRSLPSIETFAEPLLTQALREAGMAQPDVRGMKVQIEQLIELPSAAPRLLITRQTYRSRRTLLAAALHNFHEEELTPGLPRRAWLVGADGQRLALSFEAFVRCCRQLDLGGQYQQRLNRLLSPKARPTAPAGSAARAVEAMLEDNLRAQLEVALRKARLQDELESYDFHRLLPLWSRAPIVPPVVGSATPRQLYLLGKCIHGAVTCEQREVEGGAVVSITAWIPQDPLCPISRHASWEALYQWLGLRLRDPQYERFFARFIRQRDLPAFARTLSRLRASTAQGMPLELDGREQAIDDPLLHHLRVLQTRKLLDDARVLAVPTGDEDMASRHMRLQASLNAGLDLLNLAAFFVPGLGEVMLVVSAVQIANEVYEGYEAWQLGDREAALDHLFGVAESVAVGVATSAIGAATLSALQRIAFVDDLTPGIDARGQVRLRHGEPPVQSLARPGDLLRGWGHPFADTPDWHTDVLMQATGLQPGQLRRLRAEEVAPPARLLDVHERQMLHSDLLGLRGRAFEEELAQRQAPESALQAQLMRAFPSLSTRQAAALLDQAGSAQVEALQATGRIPLALAERARWAARDGRLDRACLGLHLAAAVNADTERLAVGLVQRSAPWPSDVSLELRDGAAEGPVLVASGRAHAPRGRVIVRTAEGYAIRDGETASASDLWQALLATLEPAQKRLLGRPDIDAEGLRQWLAEQAGVDRERCAELLNMAPVGTGLRPPARLADGRLGYPLSGRMPGGRQAIRSGIHRIYPLLDGAQLDAYVLDLLERRVDLWEHYRGLNATLESLRQALVQWQGDTDLISSLRRRRVATQLRRCWRRKTMDYAGDYVLEIDGERVASLPSLPADVDFSHVKRLTLRDMHLTHLDEAFLRRFSHITELDLRRNRLTQLPAGIEHLTQLRHLRASRNQIVMTAQGNRQLLQLSRLQTLDLSHNPLGRLPDLTGLNHLTHVGLRNAGIEELPDLAESLPWRAHLDLRENRIMQLRQDLLGLWHNVQRVSLYDNPLDAASAEVFDRLSGAGASSPMASVSTSHSPTHTGLLDLWIGSPTVLERSRRTQVWNELHEQPGSADLFRFLADFADTQDFDQQPAHYQARVWHMLEAAHQHEALRTRLFETAAGERTCEDRLLLVMAQLELSVLVERAMIEGPAQQVEARLLGLERSLFRIDVLDEVATRHIARLREANLPVVDEIEVRLCYRVKLRQELGLPATPHSMHYESFAPVTSSDLRRAAHAVLSAENPQALAASLAQRPFWQHYVRAHHAQRFEALAAPFHERLEALEHASANSAQWLESSNRLKEELETAERALTRTLADEAFARAAAH